MNEIDEVHGDFVIQGDGARFLIDAARALNKTPVESLVELLVEIIETVLRERLIDAVLDDEVKK